MMNKSKAYCWQELIVGEDGDLWKPWLLNAVPMATLVDLNKMEGVWIAHFYRERAKNVDLLKNMEVLVPDAILTMLHKLMFHHLLELLLGAGLILALVARGHNGRYTHFV